MTIWEACFLGAVQGVTEFLPISSTAHLLATRQLLGHDHPDDAFTTVIQLGSLVAVFAYFRTDIAKLLQGLLADIRNRRFASTPDSRMGWLIVLGSIPVAVIGLVFKSAIKSNFYDCSSIGVVAIAFAFVMLAAELWHRHRKERLGMPELQEDQIGLKQAMWMGFWQAMALLPGASRSGCTISGGLFAGLSRNAAARFSFLLAMPSILGAGLKDLYDEYKLYKNPALDDRASLFAQQGDLVTLFVGTLISAVVSYIAIAWLLAFLRKYSMNVFVVYRILLGVVLLVLVANSVVK